MSFEDNRTLDYRERRASMDPELPNPYNLDDLTRTPVSAAVINSTPRSSVSKYYLRPSDVLKQKLNAEQLKKACGSTPKARKSSRPKSLAIRPLPFRDENQENIPILEDNDFISGDDEEPSTVKNVAASPENFESRLSLREQDLCLENVQFSTKCISPPSDIPENVPPLGLDLLDSVHEQTAITESMNGSYEELNDGVHSSDESKLPGDHLRSPQELGDSDRFDTFATPCLNTPSLDITFTKEDTLLSELDDMANLSICASEDFPVPLPKSDEVKPKIEFASLEKENMSSTLNEPGKVKKVGFSINDMISFTNPKDIKLFAQIQENLFPLQVSTKRLTLLLSSESPTSPPPPVSIKKEPQPSASKTKIPKAVKLTKPFQLFNSRKSVATFSSQSYNKQATSRPISKPQSTSIKWHVASVSSLSAAQKSSDNVRYRRHTLSSAAKIKANHLYAGTTTGSETTMLQSERKKSMIPFSSVTKLFQKR